MIDFGEAKVLKRQMSQTRNAIVGREFPVPDLLKQFAERFGVQALTQRSNLSSITRLALEENSAEPPVLRSLSLRIHGTSQRPLRFKILLYEAIKASALFPDDGATRNRDAS